MQRPRGGTLRHRKQRLGKASCTWRSERRRQRGAREAVGGGGAGAEGVQFATRTGASGVRAP